MKVLGLIPARGGSKGVFRKNIRLLCGKPLLAYTAEAALKSQKLARVILSTEDEEIAAAGKRFGLDVPFIRPADLALDATPTLPVVQHALRQLENEQFEAVCLLQPTNPLRRTEDIDACLELFEQTGADAVISILSVPAQYNPKWLYWRDPKGRMILSMDNTEPIARRQDLPPAFHRDGSVYVTRANIVIEQNSLYGADVRGYEMNPIDSANIDTEDDWLDVENRLTVLNGV